VNIGDDQPTFRTEPMKPGTPLDERKRTRAVATYELPVQRFLQPDDVTCGPTCLLKVYDYYGLKVELESVTGEIDRNEDGGTLAVYLGTAALRRGFRARIYSYDLRIFDPTWSELGREQMIEKLQRRLPVLRHPKVRRACIAYLNFLSMGGEIQFDELTPGLLKRIINRDHPVLAGLSATHLYRMPRERHDEETHQLLDDDEAGDPIGHFVVISGYEHWGRKFVVLDPSEHVPETRDGRLVVDAQRLTNSILLGDLTHDAVLLEIWPEEGPAAPV
jgi:hypothetical protein